MPISIDQAVFIAYLLFILGIGVYASRFTEHTPSDFYVADKTVGTAVLGLTLLATVLSAFTFFGVASTSVSTGLGVFSYLAIANVFYAVVFATVGVSLYVVGKEMGVLTPSEYIRERYDSPLLGVVYLTVCSIFMAAMIAGQLIGGGVALETMMDIPFIWGIIGMGAFMIIYIHIAGYRGVIWSDTIQSALIFGMLAAVFVYFLATMGGDNLAQGAITETPGIFSNEGPAGVWTPLYIATFAAAYVIGVPGYPHAIQRFFSARSANIMRKSGLLYAVLAVPAYIFAAALGAWALGVIPIPDNPDYLIAALIEEMTHPVVFGLMMAGATAAIMSTSDSVALTMSSMISRDLYKQYIDKDISDAKEVQITQIVLILLILFAMAIAWIRPAGIFAIVSLAIVGFAATTPPIFLGVYWNRATEAAGYASLIIGPLIMVLFFFETIPAEYTFGMHYGFIGVVVSYLVFVVVSFATQSPETADTTNYVHRFWKAAD